MSKHIDKDYLYKLPSGTVVHPCRLMHKDGTLMWKHALLCRDNKANMPTCESHEQHILKTAQRLEELNSWVSHDMELWNCLQPVAWYVPSIPELSEGIAVCFKHNVHDIETIYTKLSSHILPHESLEKRSNHLYFRRC